MQEIFEKLIEDAIEILKAKNFKIYTFAFYHDHESGIVSICADTEENSILFVKSQNDNNKKYFSKAVSENSLSDAFLWQANVGRNLSLGDFAEVNIVYLELNSGINTGDELYLSMIKAVNSKSQEIKKISKYPDRLLFCCSTEDDEVGLTWS